MIADGGTSTAVRADVVEDRDSRESAGRWLLGVVGVLYLAVVAPVVIQGTPLADDYHTCLRPILDGSYGPFLRDSIRELGAVRPARFLEIAAISGLCMRAPFALVILIPLALKFAVGALLLGLLRDLRTPAPWPHVAAALWLLEPVGTEAALWPSALHVPLALALGIAALRLALRGRYGFAALAALGACLSSEHVIFALPLAVWLVASVAAPARRRRATAVVLGVVVAVLVVYALWPGQDHRTAVSLTDRVVAVFTQPEWYVLLPATGLGLYSGWHALVSMLPVSLVVVALGVGVGGAVGPSLFAGPPWQRLTRDSVIRGALAVAVLLALVNLPLMVTVPRGYSARTFTPTWLVLAVVVPLLAAHVDWRRARAVGAAAGAFAAVALLSLALSVSVRVETAEFTEASSRWLAERVPEGGLVEICDVERTVVEPAPLGAFHLHEFHWEWASSEAMLYHAGRRADVRRAGPHWPRECPAYPDADLTLRFDELVAAVRGR